VALVACAKHDSSDAPDPIRAIKTFTVAASDSGRVQRYAGIVQAADTSALSFQVSGTVQTVAVAPGAKVKKGQLLATLDPRRYELDVDAARAELQKARADLLQKKQNLEQQNDLYRKSWVSKAAVDQAVSAHEAARSNVAYARSRLDRALRDLESTELRAPFEGVIAARTVEPFTQVSAGKTLFELNGAGKLEVALDVPETLVSRLAPRIPVSIRFPADERISAAGEITEIGSVAGSANAFPVAVRLIDPPKSIRPGMTSQVSFELRSGDARDVYVIPLASIVPGNDARGGYVFKFDAVSSTVSKVPVKARSARANGVEIVDGVRPGDVIAAAGVSFLVHGQKVKLLQP
jgi:RND family efflux transporter MFP subunit